MKLVNNPFKLLLPLFFILASFSLDAQFTRTVVLMGGGTNTGGSSEPNSYWFDIEVEFLGEEAPCEVFVGITLEESTSQVTYYAPVPDIGGDVTAQFVDLDNVIFDELCLSGTVDSLHFVFDLYCSDGNGGYTEIDPCDPEFVPYFAQDGSCDLATTHAMAIQCPPLGYNTASTDELKVSDNIGQENIQNSSIESTNRIQNNQVDYKFSTNYITLSNLSNSSINYQILTISGQVIYQGNLTDMDIEKRIDISNLSQGLYIITYGNKDYVESKKFVR